MKSQSQESKVKDHGWDHDAWYVGFQSWAGLTWHRVTVLKECPKRSRVRFEEPAIGRPKGHEQNVPNHALKFGAKPQSITL